MTTDQRDILNGFKLRDKMTQFLRMNSVVMQFHLVVMNMACLMHNINFMISLNDWRILLIS